MDKSSKFLSKLRTKKWALSPTWIVSLGLVLLLFGFSLGFLLRRSQPVNANQENDFWVKRQGRELKSMAGGVPNFALIDHLGEGHQLYRYRNKRAVVVISQGNDCPVIQKYTPTIQRLVDQFAPQGVQFLMLLTRPKVSGQTFEFMI